MSEQTEALKLALVAQRVLEAWDHPHGMPALCQEMNTLRKALAEQPAQQQEPVAREHITDGSPCWCEPETNYKDPETGISVIVHKEPQ